MKKLKKTIVITLAMMILCSSVDEKIVLAAGLPNTCYRFTISEPPGYSCGWSLSYKSTYRTCDRTTSCRAVIYDCICSRHGSQGKYCSMGHRQ